jgi:DNA-binding transcriptional ArsR family regulator
MGNKYLLLDFSDPKMKDLAEVLGNRKCKEILEYLADNESSETEIARDLKMPANTVNYNVKKLLSSGLIEKSKDFSWSVKGKKVLKYRVANKKILISPRNFSLSRNLLISGLVVGITAFFVKIFSSSVYVESGSRGIDYLAESSVVDSSVAVKAIDSGIMLQNSVLQTNVWAWFLLGGLSALLIYMILNYRRL